MIENQGKDCKTLSKKRRQPWLARLLLVCSTHSVPQINVCDQGCVFESHFFMLLLKAQTIVSLPFQNVQTICTNISPEISSWKANNLLDTQNFAQIYPT